MSRRPLVLLGIPTHQEASTIAAFTANLDLAAQRCQVAANFVLVNMDNRSPDGTQERFLDTRTKLPKVGLQTKPGVRGKGANLRLLFEHAAEQGADAAITLDADLESVPSDWIDTLLTAILVRHVGIAVPVYARTWYDANQTNQIVAPVVLAVTGHAVRQPIGGDFAFGPRYMRQVLAGQWPAGADAFGVDSFLVLLGIKDGDLAQVVLSGGKFHSWRSNTADQIEDEFPIKFHTVNTTLFGLLATWPAHDGDLPTFPVSPEIDRNLEKPYDTNLMMAASELGFQRELGNPWYARLLGRSSTKPPHLDDEAWAHIIVKVLTLVRFGSVEHEALEAFRALFFNRVASIQTGLRGLSQAAIGQRVHALARAIYSHLNASA
jgi:hypothetical protein